MTRTVVRPSGGDDTSALISAILNFDTIIIDGILKIDDIVKINRVSNRKIKFKPGSVLARSTLSNPSGDHVTFPVMQFQDCDNFKIINPCILGPGGVCNGTTSIGTTVRALYDSRYEESAGISIDGCRDFFIRGGSIKHVRGDGIRIFFYRKAEQSDVITERVKISNVNISCVGRAAITNVRSNDVTVDRGTYNNCGMWTFNVEPLNTWEVCGYKIDRPTVGYSRSSWLFVGGHRFSKAEVTVNKPIFTELVIPESIASRARGAVKVIR